MQEAYLSAYRAIGQLRGESAVSTLAVAPGVLRVPGSAAPKPARRRQNLVPMVLADEVDAMPSHDNNSPEKLLVRTQMRNLIERKLDELPQDFRTVFVLPGSRGDERGREAACLGIPEPTVRSSHFRARSLCGSRWRRD